jgi:hypothetical protein
MARIVGRPVRLGTLGGPGTGGGGEGRTFSPAGLGVGSINPASPRQVLEALRRRGHAIEDTTEATLKTLDDDLARMVLAYRDALNRAGKYGRDFLNTW